ncbi:hypothetical protein [Deinococcus ruber]|uniref:hypothetical protein n=1 Tax=Deinococcus ruber TaxID=1848197 RepID=UPI001665B967|nr:hypothetical protein [Deinococcus ruber]
MSYTTHHLASNLGISESVATKVVSTYSTVLSYRPPRGLHNAVLLPAATFADLCACYTLAHQFDLSITRLLLLRRDHTAALLKFLTPALLESLDPNPQAIEQLTALSNALQVALSQPLTPPQLFDLSQDLQQIKRNQEHLLHVLAQRPRPASVKPAPAPLAVPTSPE